MVMLMQICAAIVAIALTVMTVVATGYLVWTLVKMIRDEL